MRSREWERFRRKNFPYQRINLNTATFGSLPVPVRDALSWDPDELCAYPLGQYEHGRRYAKGCRQLISRLWPTSVHEPAITLGATATSSLLARGLREFFGGADLSLLTSNVEHHGGIGGFREHAWCRVTEVAAETLADSSALEAVLAGAKPQVVFLSHFAFADGMRLPVDSVGRSLKEHCPESLLVVDVAQSLGIAPLPFESADILFGSFHKWCHGPRGMGVIWLRGDLLERFPAFFSRLNPLVADSVGSGFELSGGQNFLNYGGLSVALGMVADLGWRGLIDRSRLLRDFFVAELEDAELYCSVSDHPGIAVARCPFDPYPMYRRFDEHRVHFRCFRETGTLRFSIPYYESEQRLRRVGQQIKSWACGISSSKA